MSVRLADLRSSARRSLRFSNLLALALAGVTLIGLYAYHSRMLPPQYALGAVFAAPAAAIALLRPSWVVLGILVLPPGVVSRTPATLTVLVAAVPLLALALREWTIDLRPRTGAWPFLALFVYGLLHATVESTAGFADGFHKLILYYALLVLLTYNLVRAGETSVRRVVSALLAGALLNSALELALSSSPGQGGGTLLTYGRSLGNIAVMGLIVVVVRAGFTRWRLPARRLAVAAMLALLSAVVGLTLLRAAWVSIVIALAVVAVWARKTRWLLSVPLVIALVLAVPTARERVFPGAVEEGLDLTEYTTGRWRLWTEAAEEIGAAPLMGHGYGYWWSLSPEEVFGSRVAFVTQEDQEFVFLHNDALYWQIELGVLGLLLFSLFWLHLTATYVRLLRAPRRWSLPALATVAVPVMYLVTQLVGNGLALRGVSERFFIVCGAMFALATSYRESRRAQSLAAVAGPSSASESRTKALVATTSAGEPEATRRPPSSTTS